MFQVIDFFTVLVSVCIALKDKTKPEHINKEKEGGECKTGDL